MWRTWEKIEKVLEMFEGSVYGETLKGHGGEWIVIKLCNRVTFSFTEVGFIVGMTNKFSACTIIL